MDLRNLGVKKVMVVTDANLSRLNLMSRVLEALEMEAVDYVLYDRTVVEPKDSSLELFPRPSMHILHAHVSMHCMYIR